MRALGWVIGAAVLTATQAMAADDRIGRALQKLAPDERLEQLCDYTAMARIRKERSMFRPDRAVANASAEPRLHNHTIEAKGAAFRSRGKWYALSFVCTATPDHMSVLSFDYAIGPEIPEVSWAAEGLWD